MDFAQNPRIAAPHSHYHTHHALLHAHAHGRGRAGAQGWISISVCGGSAVLGRRAMASASLAVPGGSGAVQKGGEERHVVTGKATPAHIIEQSFYSPLGRSRRVESSRGKAGSAAGRVWDCCCPVEPRPTKWCVCRRVAHRNCTGQDRTGQYTFCWSTPMPPIHPDSSRRASVLVWGIWVGPGWPRPSTQPVVDPAGFDHHYHAQPVPTTGARTQYYLPYMERCSTNNAPSRAAPDTCHSQ